MSIVSTDSFSLPPSATKNLYEDMSVHLRDCVAIDLAARISLIAEGCKKRRIDGVINHYHVGCRASTGDAIVMAKALTQEFNVPVLTFPWENFDPRVYSHEQYTIN